MQSFTAFIRVVYFSFFSVEFYRDVYNNLQGKQWGYLLRAGVIVAIIMTIIQSVMIFTHLLQLNITGETMEQIGDQIPVMVIKEGELQIANKTQEGPIYIHDNSGRIIFIIDDQSKDNIYLTENAPIVVVRDGVSLSNGELIHFSTLVNDNEVVITHEAIMEYWGKTLNFFRAFLPILIFIVIFIGLVIKTIIFVMFFSVFVLLLHKVMHYNSIKFESLFRLGVFASMPAMVLYIPLFFVQFIDISLVYFAYFIFIYSKIIFPTISAE